MTPKEKAKYLFDKAIYKIQMADKYGYLLRHDERYLAKLIALDIYDEILEFMKTDDIFHGDAHMANSHHVVYWSNVKTEIENL
jgi:hypothetical protein